MIQKQSRFKSLLFTDNSGIEDVWDIGTDYNLNASTNAYFIQEDFDGTFSIYFGDGVVGENLRQETLSLSLI